MSIDTGRNTVKNVLKKLLDNSRGLDEDKYLLHCSLWNTALIDYLCGQSYWCVLFFIEVEKQDILVKIIC